MITQTHIYTHRESKTGFLMINLKFSAVTKVLEPVKDQIHQELAPKLTATDSLLKDNIGKMVRSRVRLGPDVIFFSCSIQPSMKLMLLINVKMPTIVGILTFTSRINEWLWLTMT